MIPRTPKQPLREPYGWRLNAMVAASCAAATTADVVNHTLTMATAVFAVSAIAFAWSVRRAFVKNRKWREMVRMLDQAVLAAALAGQQGYANRMARANARNN